MILSMIKNTPDQTCTTTELTHTTAKVAQTPEKKQKQLTVEWKDSSIIVNNMNSLPNTKEYLLKEYVDVFQGIGTLPGGPYHIRLKQYYQPVQHPPHSVTLVMQKAYMAELDRLLLQCLTSEVHDHRKWAYL